MDVTTISLGAETRDALAEYRDSKDHPNYNSAVRSLLEKDQEFP